MTPTGPTWALHTQLSLDDVNVHLPRLLESGLLGVVETDGRATIHLDRRSPLPIEGQWEEVAPQDWNASWRASIQPVVVGGVTILAPWHDRATSTGIVLIIEPAQAFGTGHHETTTACLQALQETNLADRSVFDVGTGTGVLGLAARAMGAAQVLGVDIDPIAVETARRNAQLNNLAMDVAEGSVELAAGEQFDVVVANLDTATLKRLASDLVAAVRPGGTFLGSGISNERSDEALTALRAAGLEVTAQPGDQWALLRGTPA